MQADTKYNATRKRKISHIIETNQKSRKRRQDCSNSSHVTDRLRHTLTAGVQRNKGTDDKGYDSEPGSDDDDEHGTSDEGQKVTSKDEQLSECPICLEKFINQLVGTTDTCNHSFCLSCLQEWLKRGVNICPLDRQMFNFIFVQHRLDGDIIGIIPTYTLDKQSEVESHVLQIHAFVDMCAAIFQIAYFFVIFAIMNII
jgi:hypothetical protein